MTQTIELEKMGLVGLGENDQKELGGGLAWLGIFGTYVLLQAALNPKAHIKAFQDGWNSL